VEDGPEVAWPSRDGDDETVDEDRVIRNVFFAIYTNVCCFNLEYSYNVVEENCAKFNFIVAI